MKMKDLFNQQNCKLLSALKTKVHVADIGKSGIFVRLLNVMILKIIFYWTYYSNVQHTQSLIFDCTTKNSIVLY